MQFGAGRADFLRQSPLDREMNILVGEFKAELSGFDFALDLRKSFGDRRHFTRGQQTDLTQHSCMRDRTADIVPVETAIEWQ